MPGDINNISDKDVLQFEIAATQEPDVNLMDFYQHLATKTAIYPGHGTPLGLMYVALKGAGEAGEFAEHVGKAMRDDALVTLREISQDTQAVDPIMIAFEPLTSERRDSLIKEVGDQLWYLSAKCNELGIKLSEAALINLQKLNDRSKRGKLSGSGDNR